MSLRNLMQQVTANYDPKTNPSQAKSIPPGEYDVVIEAVGHTVYESGYDAIAIKAKIVGGDHADRVELININVDPGNETYTKWPNLLNNAIRSMTQFIYATGLQLTDDDWEDQLTLGQAVGEALGKQCVLRITETTSKKSGKTYRNYEFLAYDDMPAF